MDYEEISRELAKPNSEIIVRKGERTVGLLEIAAMSADELINTCKVTMRGDPVSLHRSKPVTGIFEKPSEKYCFGYMWKSTGACPSEVSPELKNLCALDCLKEVYDLSKAYVEGKGWVI